MGNERGSLRQPRGGKRLREHGLHRVGDILGCVGGKEKTRRGTLLELRRDGRNDHVDLAVLIVRETRIGVGDRLIVIPRFFRGVQKGWIHIFRLGAGPAIRRRGIILIVVGAVRHQKDEGLRLERRRSGANGRDCRIYRWDGILEMSAAGASLTGRCRASCRVSRLPFAPQSNCSKSHKACPFVN